MMELLKTCSIDLAWEKNAAIRFATQHNQINIVKELLKYPTVNPAGKRMQKTGFLTC
jgi:hypothetical protein